jgi:hypothetical protein
MTDTETMAAFGASERACYEYPDGSDIAALQRAAFCAGSAWAAVQIETLRAALREAQAPTLAKRLNAEFETWFDQLQTLTDQELDPDDWTGRWYDGYSPQEAIEDGPEDDC